MFLCLIVYPGTSHKFDFYYTCHLAINPNSASGTNKGMYLSEEGELAKGDGNYKPLVNDKDRKE